MGRAGRAPTIQRRRVVGADRAGAEFDRARLILSFDWPKETKAISFANKRTKIPGVASERRIKLVPVQLVSCVTY